MQVSGNPAGWIHQGRSKEQHYQAAAGVICIYIINSLLTACFHEGNNMAVNHFVQTFLPKVCVVLILAYTISMQVNLPLPQAVKLEDMV